MDVDCGQILEGGVSVGAMGRQIFASSSKSLPAAAPNPKPSASATTSSPPWQIGAVM